MLNYYKYMKISLYGGAFNPIGNHHLIIIEKLCEIMDEVWIMPCYKSSTGKKLESSDNRVNMCNIAINQFNNNKIKLCLFEIENKYEGQTYDIMEKFFKIYNTPNITYYFVIGMDNALTINTWDNYEKLINMIPFIIFNRTKYVQSNMIKYWFNNNPHILMDSEPLEGSSTNIRNDILNNKIPDIPLDVYNYIKYYNLYNKN
jgi:nicotinate-nucleotide adenylyltransferase